MLNTKQCTKCNKIKDLSEYYKTKQRYTSACKLCTKISVALYRENNQEAVKNTNKKHYENNRERRKLASKIYRDRNPSVMKIYRENNKDRLAIQGKEYQKKNKDHLKKIRDEKKDVLNEYQKNYYNKNKELIKERTKTYYESAEYKLIQINAQAKRRSIKKRASDGTITQVIKYPLAKELQQLLEKQDHKCNNCKCDITHNKHLDHHIPLSKGGTHSITNVVWLCPRCNLSKSDKMPTTLLLL